MDILPISASFTSPATLLLLMTTLAVVVAVYGFLIEPTRLDLRTIEIPIPDLPPELEGFTILHLTDWHVFWQDVRPQRFFDALTSQKADLIVHTGDFIETDDGIPRVIERLRPFAAPEGQWAVLGNHDYYWFPLDNLVLQQPRTDRVNDTDLLCDALGDIGISVLRNQMVETHWRGVPVRIIGLDDPMTGHEVVDPAWTERPDRFTLILVHGPDCFQPEYPRLVRGHLALCGHTHGGQFRFPGLGPLMTSSALQRPSASGTFCLPHCDHLILHICRGLGQTQFLPVRFFCRPEANRVILRRGTPSFPVAQWKPYRDHGYHEPRPGSGVQEAS